ncbi:hypothetical protein HKD37_10G028225 [Glycine soja]
MCKAKKTVGMSCMSEVIRSDQMLVQESSFLLYWGDTFGTGNDDAAETRADDDYIVDTTIAQEAWDDSKSSHLSFIGLKVLAFIFHRTQSHLSLSFIRIKVLCLYAFIGLKVLCSFTFQRLQCLQSFTLPKDYNVFIYISKTLMSSVIYASKRLQCLHLHFKGFNVFSHLHFQKTIMSSFTFQRLQCLQSFTLSKDYNIFIYIYKTSMSSIFYILQDFYVFCLLHFIRLQLLLSFIGLNVLVFALLRTQRPLTSMSSLFTFYRTSMSFCLQTPTHGFSEPIQLNIFIDGLRPQSKQLLDASAGGKIKLKTPEEAMELIENMAASDHAILRCVICGGAHDSSCCIPIEDTTHEVDILDFNMASNIISNRDSGELTLGGPSNRPQQQGPSLYDRTTKLEETLAQFMQVSMSNQKSTESAIKNLEVQVGQLTKQLAYQLSRSFGANTEKNPKEESKMVSMNEGEKMIGEEKQQLVTEPEIDPVVEPLSQTEEEVEAEDDHEKEKKEKEKEKENEKENERKEEKKKNKSELAREKRKEASPSKREELLVRLESGFYYGYNVLVLIRVRWPNRGLSGGMASHNRKATALITICITEAWDRYSDNVLARNILPERNVKLYINEFDDFRRELIRRNWHKQLTNLTEGTIDVAIMKEFYANLYVPDDKSPKQVRVRGHIIKFDVDSLNTFLETPVTRPDPQELAARLCIPGRGFVLNAKGLPWKLLRKDLTTMAQTLSVLSYSNLAPTSHTSDLNLDRAKLVYRLVMKMNMNLGSLISGQISLIAQSNSSRLGFPTLITALCKARGVTSDSLTFESLSPAINLAYIKKNCWNLDEPSGPKNPGLEDLRPHLHQLSLLPYISSIYFYFSFITNSFSSSKSLHSELKAFLVYDAEPTSGPAPDHAEFVGCGPAVASYEHGGVSAEVVATPQVTPEPSIVVLDMSSSQPESSAPVPDLPLPQDSPSGTPTLDLNEHAMDST